MFSKACEYAIKACVFIAMKSLEGERVNLREISTNIDTPEAFTAKILHQLAKKDILSSSKGPKGGFTIVKTQIDKIKASDIVSAIDGDSLYTGCALGFDTCDANQPCPMHHKFVDIRNDLKVMLDSTTLKELALGLKGGLVFLKR
ncbi:Rrf2 family transcriptional regulator [Xanthomarina sp. F1114]|uniref:RrF2 family transcriptional regulator n=1 Tax=Xanthomarina sp. F1114 TaxID=2996019 RepID=UPI00225E000E|nr:Rrf2 family transcriptional regulator [Xanthomarina sp. F1114]MCX7547311.1 Rrf2 family transcriptional regulator [Xanthomarina sp. F1114]